MVDVAGYPVSDTSFAAFLYTEGFVIIDIDYSEPRRAKFIFKVNGVTSLEEYERYLRLYQLGKGTVDPATYSRVYKKLTKTVSQGLPWTEGIHNV